MLVKHMKDHLIGKVIRDVEHIESEDQYGIVQTGMKIFFDDGASIKINIEHDEDLNDRANLDWYIEQPPVDKSINTKKYFSAVARESFVSHPHTWTKDLDYEMIEKNDRIILATNQGDTNYPIEKRAELEALFEITDGIHE